MPVILPVAGLCHAMPQNALQIVEAMNVNWPIYVIFPDIRRHPAGHLLRQTQNGRLDERGRSADHPQQWLPYPAAIFDTAFLLLCPHCAACGRNQHDPRRGLHVAQPQPVALLLRLYLACAAAL